MRIRVKTEKSKPSCAIMSDACKDSLDDMVNTVMDLKLKHIKVVSEDFSEWVLQRQERRRREGFV